MKMRESLVSEESGTVQEGKRDCRQGPGQLIFYKPGLERS